MLSEVVTVVYGARWVEVYMPIDRVNWVHAKRRLLGLVDCTINHSL